MANADILLSLRIPGGDYQKYSFPSKILDYLSFKKPIVTFKLPCYSNSILNYLFIPEEVDANSVLNKINDIIKDNLVVLIVQRSQSVS